MKDHGSAGAEQSDIETVVDADGTLLEMRRGDKLSQRQKAKGIVATIGTQIPWLATDREQSVRVAVWLLEAAGVSVFSAKAFVQAEELRKGIADLFCAAREVCSAPRLEVRGNGPRAMSKSMPETRRYHVRDEDRRWLGTFMIAHDGQLSVNSDYGNYSYWWGSTGPDDLREFLCGIDTHYLLGKFSPGEEYDGAATEKAIKQWICSERRAGELTKDEAREHWEALRDEDVDTEHGFVGWCRESEIPDPYQFARHRKSPQAVMFVERVWPRFVEMLRAEMLQEKQHAEQQTASTTKMGEALDDLERAIKRLDTGYLSKLLTPGRLGAPGGWVAPTSEDDVVAPIANGADPIMCRFVAERKLDGRFAFGIEGGGAYQEEKRTTTPIDAFHAARVGAWIVRHLPAHLLGMIESALYERKHMEETGR